MKHRILRKKSQIQDSGKTFDELVISVEYVKLLLWPKENPFSDHANGDSIAIDGDDPQHITWIYEKALERSNTVSIFFIN